MLNTMSRWFARTPRRLVQMGLWMFFAGAAALLLGLVAQLGGAGPRADHALSGPLLPAWFVPESAAGFTLAASLVCWGVWAMGSGLRLSRRAAGRR